MNAAIGKARPVAASAPVGPMRGASAAIVLGAATALLLVLVGYPLLWLLMAAFGLPDGFQLGFLTRVYTRAQNLQPLINTITLAAGTGLLSIMLGVPLAFATARSDMPLRRVVHALVALSYITPPYLTALAYVILLGPDAGYFNRVLQAVTGLERGPLNIFSMGGVIFVIGLHVFAFTYFMTHTALRSVDASFEEAARTLGAGPSFAASICPSSRLRSPAAPFSPRWTRWRCSARRRSSAYLRRSPSCRRVSTA